MTGKSFILWWLFQIPILTLTAQGLRAGDSAKARIDTVAVGIASYYHNKFEGRVMANGAIFHQAGMTAASNTLPLNCWVRVTNLSNNRSVVVQITDRMHHRNKRLIDLSRTAATQLKYIGKGLTRVKVEYLGKKKPPVAGPGR